MAFKEVSDLSCDTTISLGGMNKKSGKKNPVSIEGYYIGSKSVEDRKKKSGVSYIYIFQTSKGNVGVWGKTDLDRKMASVSAGTMTRVTHSGMQATPNGEMYKYRVETDQDNTIEVASPSSSSSSSLDEEDSSSSYSNNDEPTIDSDDDEEVSYTPPPVAASSHRASVARTPSADAKARAQALLNGRSS